MDRGYGNSLRSYWQSFPFSISFLRQENPISAAAMGFTENRKNKILTLPYLPTVIDQRKYQEVTKVGIVLYNYERPLFTFTLTACSSFALENAGGNLHGVFKMLLAKERIDETARERKIANIVTKPRPAYFDNYFT